MSLQPSRLSRWLAPIAQLLAIAVLVLNASFWLVPGSAETAARHLAGLSIDTPITLSTTIIIAGLVLSTLHLAILTYALFAVSGIFRAFAAGNWFPPDIGNRLNRFGLALLLFGLGATLVQALMTFVLTMHNPPGQRLFKIGFSSNDCVLILVGTLIVMLGYAMKEAVRMADENRQIV